MKTILYTWFAVLLFGMAAVSCGDDDTKNNDTTGITGSSWKASETVGADRTTKKYTFKASANWVAQSDKPEWCKILTSSGDKGSDRQLNITVEANETGSTRSANITVQVSGYARAAVKEKEYGFGIAGLMGVRFVDGNNQPTGEYGLVVTSVYPDSPASEAGFRRGTFFAQYNGAAITAANLNSVYGTLIAPGGASTVKLTENKQGAQPVSLTAREIYPNPVIHSEVITSGAHRIGYLVYDSFDAAYDDELLAAVKKLKDGNITDMVLDLRNNGGGHVISSNMLSTCIAGAACQGKVYEYYRYNDSRMATVEKTARETGKEYDTAAKKFFDEFYYGDYYGVDLRNYALNMTRLYVLVTGNTASSSEAVINTLRGLDGFTVKLIGEKTNGKNVGMEVSKFTVGNYSYELAPISFQGYNAKQVTVDKNGLAVDTACEEWDGELKDYGDRSEPMLAAALSQITGQKSVSVSGTRSTAPGVRPATDIALPDLSNRPSGMIVFLPASKE
mgnify:CR=1 FL=1